VGFRNCVGAWRLALGVQPVVRGGGERARLRGVREARGHGALVCGAPFDSRDPEPVAGAGGAGLGTNEAALGGDAAAVERRGGAEPLPPAAVAGAVRRRRRLPDRAPRTWLDDGRRTA